MAADADGTILGVRVDHLDEVGAYPQAGSAAGMGALIFTGPYRIPKLSFSTQSAFTNTCSRAPYRGPWQIETYLREQAVDRLARTHGHRPDRTPAPQRHPARPAAAHPARGSGTRPCVAGGDVGAGRRDDPLRRVPPRATGAVPGGTAARDRHRAVHRAAGRHGCPMPPSRLTSVSSRAAASTCTSGRGRTDKASRRRPPSSSPTPRCRVRRRSTVHQGDTSETPYAFGTGGSRSGPILGAAIQLAAQELARRSPRSPPINWKHRKPTSTSSTATSSCAAHRRARPPSPRSRIRRTWRSVRSPQGWNRASRS